MTFKLIVGDPSGSNSERWRLEVKDTQTGQTILRHSSREYGKLSKDLESTFNQFRRGRTYKFKLIHAGTDPELLKNPNPPVLLPDYDWALEISY